MTKSQVNERAAFSSDLERFDGIKKSPTSDAFFYCNYCKADTAFKSSQSAATTVYDHVSSAEHKKALSTLHKSLSDSLSRYTEEKEVCQDLSIGIFEPKNKKYFLFSNETVIEYDVRSGQRLHFFKHTDKIIGLHIIRDKLIVITADKKIALWNYEKHIKVKQFRLMAPELKNCSLIWTYEESRNHNEETENIPVHIYVLTELMKESLASETSAVLFRFTIPDQSNLSTDDEKDLVVERVLTLDELPLTKRCLAIGNDFAVVCRNKRIKICIFLSDQVIIDEASSSNPPQKRHRRRSRHSGTAAQFHQPFGGRMEFNLSARFDVADQSLVKFDGVSLCGNNLYTSLNIGRLYEWSDFLQHGLNPSKRFFVTLFSYDFVFAMSRDHQTAIFGTGAGLVTKYNINATAGAGRWHSLEQIPMEAPIEGLLLNQDCSLILVVLADNSALVIRTSTMCLTLYHSQVPILKWAGVNVDSAQSEYLVTNARLGYLQWIDPIRWRTIAMVDISEENVSPRDTFNVPNYIWLNTYSICLTASLMVTCECRRNEPNKARKFIFYHTLNNEFKKTYIKFFRRVKPGTITDFRFEDCHVLDQRIAFIRSTNDDLPADSSNFISNYDTLYDSEVIVAISTSGTFYMYERDDLRQGHWRYDYRRSGIRWQKSIIISCSRIRLLEKSENAQSHLFATVNSNNTNSKSASFNNRNIVLLWRLTERNLTLARAPIDSIRDIQQVEWAPQNGYCETTSTMLFLTSNGLCGYDVKRSIISWVVFQPGLSLFSNLRSCFAYDANKVILFDPETGLLSENELKFEKNQSKVVCTGRPGNLHFTGIAANGELSVLKPELNASISQRKTIEPKTPFAQLLKPDDFHSSKRKTTDSTTVTVMQQLSARKLLNGPAHTLAPITKIAPIFIRACLPPKKSRGL